MEEEKKLVPPSSKKRYPLYFRALQQLQEKGVERVMSYQIGNMCSVAANTVRRDLMYVKHKGRTAAGYEVSSLLSALNDELGTTNDTPLVLIGVGNIGSGLLKYNYIPAHVGRIVCAYDVDPHKIGTKLNGVPIFNMNQLKSTFPSDCQIVILAVPKDNIDDIINKLISLKVKAVVNFSDGIPRRRTSIQIHQVDLAKIVSEIIYDFKNK